MRLHPHEAQIEVEAPGANDIECDLEKRIGRPQVPEKLLSMLLRYVGGESDLWSVVQVPSPAEEDARQLHRELLTLQRQATEQTKRIKGLLASCGLAIEIDRHFPNKLKELQQWDGTPVPEALRQRLLRECERLQVANR